MLPMLSKHQVNACNPRKMWASVRVIPRNPELDAMAIRAGKLLLPPDW
jgi:hypothetical protein